MMGSLVSALYGVIDASAVAEYFLSRQNPDGGFCFYGLNESSLNDTAFAVLSLELLGHRPGNEKVVDYIRTYQDADGSFQGIYVAWLALKALSALGETTLRDPSGYAAEAIKKHRILKEVYIESPSIFETTFYLADVLKLLGLTRECEVIAKQIVSYVKSDGSIGGSHPGLASTYYALAIMDCGGIALKKPENTACWARDFAMTSGGFSKMPYTGLAFMDETYYGVQIFRILGEKPPYIDETISYVAGCQNENGGFRRALSSGISGFETSYFALEAFQTLIKIKYQSKI